MLPTLLRPGGRMEGSGCTAMCTLRMDYLVKYYIKQVFHIRVTPVSSREQVGPWGSAIWRHARGHSSFCLKLHYITRLVVSNLVLTGPVSSTNRLVVSNLVLTGPVSSTNRLVVRTQFSQDPSVVLTGWWFLTCFSLDPSVVLTGWWFLTWFSLDPSVVLTGWWFEPSSHRTRQ